MSNKIVINFGGIFRKRKYEIYKNPKRTDDGLIYQFEYEVWVDGYFLSLESTFRYALLEVADNFSWWMSRRNGFGILFHDEKQLKKIVWQLIKGIREPEPDWETIAACDTLINNLRSVGMSMNDALKCVSELSNAGYYQ